MSIYDKCDECGRPYLQGTCCDHSPHPREIATGIGYDGRPLEPTERAVRWSDLTAAARITLVQEALDVLRQLPDQDKAAVLWDAMQRHPETIPSFVHAAGEKPA